MRLFVFAALVTLVTACSEATAPRRFTLGPGCTWLLPIRDLATLRVEYADCTAQNHDSLRAEGWEIVWDTTWVDHR